MIKEGSLLHTPLLRLIGDIFREHFTGAMRLESGSQVRIIYFREGRIISCGTNVNAEKMDEVLLGLGKISAGHIREALAHSPGVSEIGKSLLAMGFLSQAEVEEALRYQVTLIFQNLLRAPETAFSLVESYAPTRTDVFLYPTDHFISDFIHSTDDRELIFSLMPPPQARMKGKPMLSAYLEALPWDEEEKALAGRLDGSVSLAEMAGQTRMKEMEVYKLFAILNCLDLLEGAPETEIPPAQDAPTPLAEELFRPSIPPGLGVRSSTPSFTRGIDGHSQAGYHLRTHRIFEVYPLVILSVAILIFAVVLLMQHFTQKPTAQGSDPFAKPAALAAAKSQKTAEPSGIAPFQLPTQVSFPSPPRTAPPVAAPIQNSPASGAPAVQPKPQAPSPTPPSPSQSVQTPKPAAALPTPSSSNTTRPRATAETPKSPPAAPSRAPASPAPSKPITKAPPAPPAGLASEAAAMMSKMKGRPGASMTLQLMIACQEDSIIKARRQDTGGALWFIPFSLKGRSCYKVFWGVYAKEPEARKALDALPAELKSGPPRMVTLGTALSNASH